MDDLSDKKVLVISDLHLGKRFSPRRYKLIRRLLSECDKVIVDGDFFEGYALTLERFLDTSWKRLFPFLLEKDMVYVFGNHDKQGKNLQGYKKFCVLAADSYEFIQNGVTFHVAHGHEYDPSHDVNHRLPRQLLAVSSALDTLAIRLLGDWYLRLYNRGNNRIINKWKEQTLPRKDWLICGHTHLAYVSEADRYANTGILKSLNGASYLIVEGGEVKLHYVNE